MANEKSKLILENWEKQLSSLGWGKGVYIDEYNPLVALAKEVSDDLGIEFRDNGFSLFGRNYFYLYPELEGTKVILTTKKPW